MTENKSLEGSPSAGVKEDADDAGGADRERRLEGGAKGAGGGKNPHKDDVPLVDRPGFQKLVAALLCWITAAISIALLALVVRSWMADGGGEWHTALSTVSIGLFGVLITGLFVFMAFRIDRGAKLEAQRVAKGAAKKAAKKAAKRAAKRAANEARRAARKKAEEVAAERAEEVAAERAEEVAVEKTKEVAERAEEAAAKRAQEAVQKETAKMSSDIMIRQLSNILEYFDRRKKEDEERG